MSKRWQKRYDDLKFRERGHREMFTPRSAGMTEVALTENAFAALRQPGAQAEEIMESYNTMISRLYRQCEEDGLTREEVAESSRVVLASGCVRTLAFRSWLMASATVPSACPLRTRSGLPGRIGCSVSGVVTTRPTRAGPWIRPGIRTRRTDREWSAHSRSGRRWVPRSTRTHGRGHGDDHVGGRGPW
ncbi:hypothetical protein AHiyo8_01940 [Arthrobacter sp. Hiyo8]|nr:hypothetical protein AHiyo8_01940 [Arthrobacter sp. Hiyo8]